MPGHTSGVELSSRPRQREGLERCPYCHDLLGDTDLAKIECPACHTQHHVACIQELGRCTVHGCEQSITAPVDMDRHLEDSPALRQIRTRLRQRARRFVRSNARNRRDQLLEAMARAREHEAAGRLEEASRAYADVAYFERLPELESDPQLEAVPGRLSPIEARRKSRALLVQHHAIRLKRLKVATLVLLAAFLGIWVFGVLVFGT